MIVQLFDTADTENKRVFSHLLLATPVVLNTYIRKLEQSVTVHFIVFLSAVCKLR